MLNNNANASLGLHADSNIQTTLHQNAELKVESSAPQDKSFIDKLKGAATQLGEQVAHAGKQIGDTINNIGNKDSKLEPILNNVSTGVTPNELHDIPAHNQTQKPHWETHPHTHEVNNSGALNQGAFVGEVGSNILEKESEKHGVNPSDKVHFDAHPHTHDVSNSGALNQGAFVGEVGSNILDKESEKHGVNPSDKVHFDAHPHTHDVSNSGALNQGISSTTTAGVSASEKPHWPVHSIPTDASLSQDVYAQGSVSTQSSFVTHPDHTGAHAGLFDKTGSDLIAKEQELEHKKDASAHGTSELLEKGKEKLEHLGDKVKAALVGDSTNATVHTKLGVGL